MASAPIKVIELTPWT